MYNVWIATAWAVASLAVLAFVGITAIADAHRDGDVIARVYGCPSEDSCTIDYTRNGVWVIRKDRP